MPKRKKRAVGKREMTPRKNRPAISDIFGRLGSSFRGSIETIGEKTHLADFLGKTVSQDRIERLLEAYEKSNISIGVLGGHSALDICRGANKHGFRTVVVCQKGREKTYSKYYKSRDNKGVVDEIILVDN